MPVPATGAGFAVSLFMKAIITFLSAVWLTALAHPETYTFIGDNDNWSVPANWSPLSATPVSEWRNGDTGIVANAVALAAPNTPRPGIQDDAPTMVLGHGGLIRVPGNGTDQIFTPFVFDGGALEFNKNMTLHGAMHVMRPATITFNYENNAIAKVPGCFHGSESLTLQGTVSNMSNWDNNSIRFQATREPNGNAGFTGHLHLKTRVYFDAAGIPAGPITIHPGGFFDIGAINVTRDLTLAGGALRGYGNGTLRGTTTLTANSWLDAAGSANRLTFYGPIIGEADITVGASELPGSGKPGQGTVYFYGDNRGWRGDLILRHTAAASSNPTQFATNNVSAPLASQFLPSGAIRSLNATPCGIQFNGNIDWIVTNSLIGPLTINVGANKYRRLTLDNAVLAPSGTPSTTGETTICGRLNLTNSTLRMRLLNTGHDRLVLAPSSGGSALPTLQIHGTRLELSIDYAPLPGAVLFLVVNNADDANTGTFSGLAEGAAVTLSTSPLRTAQIAYAANSATSELFGGNDIALYNFVNHIEFTTPQIGTGVGATNIRVKSATLNGELLAGTPAPNVIICWGNEDPGSTDPADWQHTIDKNRPDGAFYADIAGLQPSTTYYYACRADNHDNGVPHEVWSATSSFTTPAPTAVYWNAPTWNNSTACDWSNPAHWSPAPPVNADYYGYVTNGTANINGDLGETGDRPTIIATSGGTLYVRAGPVNETPLILDGGAIHYESRVRLSGGLRIISDSAITCSQTTPNYDGSGRIFSEVFMPAGVTLATRGAMYMDGVNPGFNGVWQIGPGRCGIYNHLALGGDASVILGQGAEFSYQIAVSAGGPLDLRNPFSGVGIFHTGQHDDGFTTASSLMPGSPESGGTMAVSTEKLTFAETARLDVNLWNAANHGRLLVLNTYITGGVTYTNRNINIIINPGAALNITPKSGFRTRAGDVFVLVNNIGANAIQGEFAGLSEGAKINLGHASGDLTYTHIADDDGLPNDIAITNIRLDGTLLFLK